MSEPFLGEVKMVGFNFPPRGWAQCDGQLLPISQNAALFSILGTSYGGDGRTTFGLPDLRGRVPIHVGDSGALAAADLDGAGLGTAGALLAALPFLASKDPVSRRSALTFGAVTGAALYLAACENPLEYLEEAPDRLEKKDKSKNFAGLASVILGERGGTEGHSLTTLEMPNHGHAVNVTEATATTDEPTDAFPARASDTVYGALHGGAKGAMGTSADPVVLSIGAGAAHTNMQPYTVLNFVIALQGLFPSPS